MEQRLPFLCEQFHRAPSPAAGRAPFVAFLSMHHAYSAGPNAADLYGGGWGGCWQRVPVGCAGRLGGPAHPVHGAEHQAVCGFADLHHLVGQRAALLFEVASPNACSSSVRPSAWRRSGAASTAHVAVQISGPMPSPGKTISRLPARCRRSARRPRVPADLNGWPRRAGCHAAPVRRRHAARFRPCP